MRGATLWLALACSAARAADVVETCAWNVHEATCAGPRAYAAQRAYYDEVVALDAHLRSVGAPPAEGHSAMCPRAVAHMRAVARAAAETSQLVRVCEVGFNAGHSTLNWLAADPRTAVDAFDLGAHPSAAAAFAYLSKKYPGRLRLTLGDSRATLPRVGDNLQHVVGAKTPRESAVNKRQARARKRPPRGW